MRCEPAGGFHRRWPPGSTSNRLVLRAAVVIQHPSYRPPDCFSSRQVYVELLPLSAVTVTDRRADLFSVSTGPYVIVSAARSGENCDSISRSKFEYGPVYSLFEGAAKRQAV